MNLDLSGKRAVVCGSTQGIGKAIAIELSSLGAHITLMARNEDRLKTVLTELHNTENQTHEFLVADFNVPTQVTEAIQRYVQKEAVHILINNTGGPAPGLALDADTDAYINAFKNHVVCNQILVQAIVPAMKKEKYGRIINVISSSVKTPIYGLGVSNTIRGAVANWAKTLSMELGPYGITVNNLLPGSIMTGRLDSLIKSRAEKAGKSYDEMKAEMIREIPVGRIGEPHEIAAVAAFLCSPAAAYISGINVPVDGGKMACM